MSSYRYVVFPPGRQPTAEEAAELVDYARLLEDHIAYGTNKQDGALAMAFEADAFDRARSSNANFDALISKWEARGSRVVDHLGFVKDATALKPIKQAPRHLGAASKPGASAPRLINQPARASVRFEDQPARASVRFEAPLPAKDLAAKEAHARAGLALHRTLERFAALQRFAAWGPYALMALAALSTLAAGLYISDRLLDAGRKPHKETIERLAD
jgi:hypothetical protein